MAQFQSFCRDLHDEAIDVHILHATPGHRQTIRRLMQDGRKLDTHNPRRSTLGSDFLRVGIDLVGDVKRSGKRGMDRLEDLDRLVDYRNAVGHGDEARIEDIERHGRVRATKQAYQKHRRSLDGLASTMDAVVAEGLAHEFGTDRPW